MTPVAESALPFDRVVIADGSRQKEFTVTAFLALPLPVRVGYLLGGGLEFFLGAVPVDRVKALSLLRQYRTERPTGANRP